MVKRTDTANRNRAVPVKGARLRRWFAVFVCVSVFMVCVCGWRHRRNDAQIERLLQEKSAVTSQIDEEYAIQIRLMEEKTYNRSEVYLARLARERFNLLNEGDHLYVFD